MQNVHKDTRSNTGGAANGHIFDTATCQLQHIDATLRGREGEQIGETKRTQKKVIMAIDYRGGKSELTFCKTDRSAERRRDRENVKKTS